MTEKLTIAILPFGFMITSGETPVALCNNLTVEEANRLALFLNCVGSILAKGNVQILVEESIATQLEGNIRDHFFPQIECSD